MNLNIIKYIFHLLMISLFLPFNCHADTYLSVLRGDKIILYKSILPGVVHLNDMKAGEIKSDKTPFRVNSYEAISKLNILLRKKSNEERKRKQLLGSLKIAEMELNKGLISRRELESIRDSISNINIIISEIKSEIHILNQMISMNTPMLDGNYIIRNIFVNNGDYVRTGDSILEVETLGNYHVDIKFDPSSINGNIRSKKIRVKSLVNGFASDAIVSNVYSINNGNGNGDSVHGLKVASLLIEKNSDSLNELLDTTFEISIND